MDLLRPALETNREAMFIAREDGTLVEANDSACAMFGYGPGEMLGLPPTALVDAEDPRAAIGARSGAFLGKVTFIRKGGERFPGELSSVRVNRADGVPFLWLTAWDSSALEAQRSSEENFRALSEATFEAVAIHDLGTIVLANKAADDLLGLPSGGLVGRRISDYAAPQSVETIIAHASAGDSAPYQAFGKKADGTTFPVEIRGNAIVFRGKPMRIVTMRDLTERKRLEASLALADRLASIGTLAAGVAHEINNPLAYVLLNIELARRTLSMPGAVPPSPAMDRVREALRDAHEGAERVRRIVGDLRGFARGDDGEAASIDLERAAGFACAMARGQVQQRARFEVSLGGMPPVRGNETRLGQVFLNLLVNAADAIPEGDPEKHCVSVEARRESEAWVVVEVSDTGSGIAPEMLPHVFEPFVTTKSRDAGTGLGLSIAQGILTSIGATIEVASQLGQGTTFRVRLPVGHHVMPATATPTGQFAAHRPTRRYRVLVIDDEDRVRKVVTRVLEDSHDVVACGSGREALQRLSDGEQFDAVLLDLMMPDTSGMDVHASIAESWPDLARRTAILTGGTMTDRAREFVEQSRLPRLDKPFDVAALESVVRRLVSRREPRPG